MTAPEVPTNKSIFENGLAFARSGKWEALLDLLDRHPESALDFPRLLIFQLHAAVALDRPELVPAIAKMGASISGSEVASFALVRELDKHGYSDLAAELVLSRDDLQAAPFFLRSAKRLRQNTSGRTRQRLVKAYAKASNNGDKVVPIPSSFAFPKRQKQGTIGAVCINHASSVNMRHVDRLTADTESFTANISKPKEGNIVEYHDVFADRHGQIWKGDGTIIYSVGMPIPDTNSADIPQVDIAVLAASMTRGIYHFLVDRLPFLSWMVDYPGADVPILLGDNAPAFQAGLLRLAGFSENRLLNVGDAVFVKRLIKVHAGFGAMVGWSHIAPITDRIVANSRALATQNGVELPQRIYISRASATRRQMTNELDVHAEMKKRDVAVYQFEHIPLWHQVALAASADTIIGPHGAGLAHLVLARSGTQVIEILPIAVGTYFLRWNYSRISQIRGHDYAAWLEEQPLPISDKWSTTLPEFLPFLGAQLGKSVD